MPVKAIFRELHFPLAGVTRLLRLHGETGQRDSMYPTPWSANVWPRDPTTIRFRGGSRAGLTKFHVSSFGSSITDMISVQTVSGEALVALVDSGFTVVKDGSLSSSASGPSSGFLVAGDQKVYAVNTAGITEFKLNLGTSAALEASAGTVPTGCTHGAVYRGRLFAAGADNKIFCSKMNDFTNWDLGVDVSDTRRAKRFQLSKTAEVGGQCTALVPYEDSALLAATAKSLWTLKADPNQSGPRLVSHHVGIISSGAWCSINGLVVFLAEDGLHKVKVDGSDLAPIGREKIPAELLDVDTTTTTVRMGYDLDAQGVHIFVTTLGTDVHWFFHLPSESFWPMELQSGHEPTAVCRYAGDLLLGGSDGYVRKVTGSDDDGTNIESHVLIGPLRVGRPGVTGMVRELVGVIGAGSGTVNWRLIVGDSAEGVAADGKSAIEAFQAGGSYSSYVKASGAWAAGRNRPKAPRIEAIWACIWLQSTAGWSYENITIETAKHRRWD